MGVIQLILESLWLILPAYFANAMPVLLKGKILIDFNKKFFDGKPLLGKGKTFEGLIGGILIAGIVGWLMQQIGSVGLISQSFQLGIILGAGALFGDIVESFFKRRMNLKRGADLPIFDQLDFLFGALLFVYLFADIIIIWQWVIILIIITPPLHRVSNIISYLTGSKDVPW